MKPLIFSAAVAAILTLGIACASGPFLDETTVIRLAETFEQREQLKIEDPLRAGTAGCSTHHNISERSWRYYSSAEYRENGIWIVKFQLGQLPKKKVCTYVVSDEDGVVTGSEAP